MAIQAWTGSGVVGPIDVMARRNPRGKGKAMHKTRSEAWSQQTGRAGLGLAWVGWWRA